MHPTEPVKSSKVPEKSSRIVVRVFDFWFDKLDPSIPLEVLVNDAELQDEIAAQNPEANEGLVGFY